MEMIYLVCDWLSHDMRIKATIKTQDFDVVLPKGWTWNLPMMASDWSYASGPMETFDFWEYEDIRLQEWRGVKEDPRLLAPLMTPVPVQADVPIVVMQ